MICPKCGNKTRVFDSRPMSKQSGVIRMRYCIGCKYEFYTLETPIDEQTGRLVKCQAFKDQRKGE